MKGSNDGVRGSVAALGDPAVRAAARRGDDIHSSSGVEGLAPITAELRAKLAEYEPTEGKCNMITRAVGSTGYARLVELCDAIDAIHEGLERENAELRERLNTSERQKESYREDLLAANRQVHASYNDGYDEGFANADDWMADNEDAMAEHGWVRGPLDADGEMWRSGDMSDSNWGVIEGIAYEDGRWFVSGHDTSAPWVPADSIRHHHAPTVEGVLREFTRVGIRIAAKQGIKAGEIDFYADEEAIAEFAGKLRLAGDDAE